MALQELADSQYSIPKKQILTYLLLTFGLTWGIAALPLLQLLLLFYMKQVYKI